MSQLCGSGLSNRSNVTSAADDPNEAAARNMPPITGTRAAHLPLRAMPKAFSMNLIGCIGFLQGRIIVVLLLVVRSVRATNFAVGLPLIMHSRKAQSGELLRQTGGAKRGSAPKEAGVRPRLNRPRT